MIFIIKTIDDDFFISKSDCKYEKEKSDDLNIDKYFSKSKKDENELTKVERLQLTYIIHIYRELCKGYDRSLKRCLDDALINTSYKVRDLFYNKYCE